MKLADQLLVAMGEDLSLIKELGKIRSEIKNPNISTSDLLHFYDTLRSLMDKQPKHKRRIDSLKREVSNLIKKAGK